MSEDFFINRHGKKSDVEPIAVQEVKKSPVKKRIQLPKFKIPRIVVIIALGIILAGCAAFFLTADSVKRDLELQANTMKTSVQALSTKTASTETTGSQTTKDLIAQLNAASECRTAFSFLSDVYGPARSATTKCQAVAKQYKTLKEKLGLMNETAQYLEAQKAIIAPALTVAVDAAFAEIPAEVTAWQTVTDKLAALKTPDALKQAHNSLIKRAEGVRDSWKELQAAFDSQNAESFTAAEAKVTKAYETLRQSGADFQTITDKLQKDILTAQAALN